MIASTNYAAVTLIAAGGALIVGIIVVLVLRHRAKGTRAEIPAGMRPGPSDQALETPLLLKLQGWGVVLVTFFVLWFPVMWLLEPGTNLTQEQANELQGGVINALDPNGKPILAYPKNLTTICGGADFGHPDIFTIDDIYQVIEEGRGAMPSWSIRFAGALDDQQINDLVLYLVQLSSQNVPFEQNVCLNKAASDAAIAANVKAGSPIDARDP
jgi:hypothetical protein